MATIWGYWSCDKCMTNDIRGDIRECPNCGAPRDKSVKFYIKNKTDYISEEKVNEIGKEPDWICSFCESLNSSKHDYCKSCGGSKIDSEHNYHQMRAKEEQETLTLKNENAQYTIQESYDMISRSPNEYISYIETDSMKRKSLCNSNRQNSNSHSFNAEIKNKNNLWNIFKSNISKILFILSIIAAIICGICLLVPKPQEVTITDFSWERNVTIQEYRTVDESGWTLPSGGRLHYTREEIYGYDKVLDHYETEEKTITKRVQTGTREVVIGYRDNGNGTFDEIISTEPIYETVYETVTEQVPVYKDVPIYKIKYYYEIDKWVYDRTEKSSNNNHDPKWPEYTLDFNERKSGESEILYIHTINKDGKEKQYSVGNKLWHDLEINENVKLKTFIDGRAELWDAKEKEVD